MREKTFCERDGKVTLPKRTTGMAFSWDFREYRKYSCAGVSAHRGAIDGNGRIWSASMAMQTIFYSGCIHAKIRLLKINARHFANKQRKEELYVYPERSPEEKEKL